MKGKFPFRSSRQQVLFEQQGSGKERFTESSLFGIFLTDDTSMSMKTKSANSG